MSRHWAFPLRPFLRTTLRLWRIGCRWRCFHVSYRLVFSLQLQSCLLEVGLELLPPLLEVNMPTDIRRKHTLPLLMWWHFKALVRFLLLLICYLQVKFIIMKITRTVLTVVLPSSHNTFSQFSHFQLFFKITAVWEMRIYVVLGSSLLPPCKTLTNPLSWLLSFPPASYLFLFPVFIINVRQNKVYSPDSVPEEHSVPVGLQFVRLEERQKIQSGKLYF